jgi:regulator of sigma E protease
VGMGPALFQRQKGETLYSLRAIPLGGYCAMEGENEESENPRAFNNKGFFPKLLVLFAGAAMNVLVAILVMIIAVSIMGVPTTTLSKVAEGQPAYEAGIRAGDEITAVNGVETSTWAEAVGELNKIDAGQSVDITVARDGSGKTYNVTPVEVDGRYMIGIEATLSRNPVLTIPQGVRTTWNVNKELFVSLKMIFTGKVSKDDVAGPVGIVTLVSDSKDYGIVYYLYLVSLISLNLAIINLLPFPALDGGRILFVIIRKITGNMISDNLEGAIHLIGLSLLLMLFVFITYNDILRLFN